VKFVEKPLAPPH